MTTVTTLPTAKPADDSLADCCDGLSHAIAMLRFLNMELERQRETIYTDAIQKQIDFGEYLIYQHILETLDDAHGAASAALEATLEKQRAA